MALNEELSDEVATVFQSRWTIRNGNVVPESENLKLSNESVKLDAVVLYVDIDESTKLVDKYESHFAAEVYKGFLHCAAKIILAEDGKITAYDGDRIMAVFIGENKNTSAIRAALKINCARIEIINPTIKKQYPKTSFILKHTVGIDAGELFVARTGVRGANDLVWVGRAANHAAKLCAFSSDYSTRITGKVYNSCHESVKTSNGRSMWEMITWTEMKRKYYRSNFYWEI
jgi:class 3 adenylate cyclase